MKTPDKSWTPVSSKIARKGWAKAIVSIVVISMFMVMGCSELPTEVQQLEQIQAAGTPSQQAVQATGSNCVDGTQPSGAVYRICLPDPVETWNGDLVIFAHGYVNPQEPVQIPEDQLTLPDGTSIPGIVNGLGYAFAVSSYSKNGLAIKEGIQDLLELRQIFVDNYGEPGHVYLVGASEGGLVTTLSVEQFPESYDGGLATCGPIGNFVAQINYIGDFRVIFDYFFPGVIPGSPVDIPQEVIDNWENLYVPQVLQAIAGNPSATGQLIRVTHAAVDPSDPASVAETVIGVLNYDIYATNDARMELGGQPYDNSKRIYVGSDNDIRLNLKVKRFKADPAAVREMQTYYQTSGDLVAPLTTLHTVSDPIVPFWHELLYKTKAILHSPLWLHTNIPVVRYGHCNFTEVEVLVAFAVTVLKVTVNDLANVENVLHDSGKLQRYHEMVNSYRDKAAVELP